MNWKKKLTSRKMWAAIASFVALLIVALGGAEAQATQITAIIMAGATVVAYIVGEGLADAASAGASVTINGNPTITAGNDATTPDSAPVVGTAETVAPATNGAETGTMQAVEVKQDTALSPESGAVAPNTNGAA
jgi:hypothetical protein